MSVLPKRYFISPHPDDIAFSCFSSLVTPPLKLADATIITIFSRSKFTFNFEWQKYGIEGISSIRAEEEELFCKQTGCRLERLNFDDSSIRYSIAGEEYRRSVNDAEELTLLNAVAERLSVFFRREAKNVAINAAIYVPLGVISGHIDHLIALYATIKAAKEAEIDPGQLLYYEELPYAEEKSEGEIEELAMGLSSHLQSSMGLSSYHLQPLLVDLEGFWKRKRDGLSCYKSQMEGTSTIKKIEHHAMRVGNGRRAERIWIASPNESRKKRTLAWVTWEASRQMGGVGMVLSNLVDDEKYRDTVTRTLLIGPLFPPITSKEYDPFETVEDVLERLDAEILYRTNSTLNSTVASYITDTFRQIERCHGVEIVYMRDRKSSEYDGHVLERLLFNLTACVTPRNVYSPSLKLFLDRLKHELDLDLSYGNIRQYPPLFEILAAVSNSLGVNLVNNAVLNKWWTSAIENNEGIYRHIDNDYVYGLLLAEPAVEAVQALLSSKEVCVITVQDYFSLPTGYAALLHRRRNLTGSYKRDTDSNKKGRRLGNYKPFRLRTLYYAGEIKTIRNLVEGITASGAAFTTDAKEYVLGGGLSSDVKVRNLIEFSIPLKGAESFSKDEESPRKTIHDFNQLQHISMHSDLRLIQQAWKLDRIMTVSDYVFDELLFLDGNFRRKGDTPVFYHGNRQINCSVEMKRRCRANLLTYAAQKWGFPKINTSDPDRCFVITRIARPMMCKAIHRDILLLKSLQKILADNRQQALLLIVTSWSGDDPIISKIKDNIEKYEFDKADGSVFVRIVNAPRWPEQTEKVEGKYLPAPSFTRDDLHRATDAALGLSAYESFGLSALEPLSCGAICVLSKSAGSMGMLDWLRATEIDKLNTREREKALLALDKNILRADFLDPLRKKIEGKLSRENITKKDHIFSDRLFSVVSTTTRDEIDTYEEQTSEKLAEQLYSLLPQNDNDRRLLIDRGAALSKAMSWERVIKAQFLSVLEELMAIPVWASRPSFPGRLQGPA
ncbi:MAG: PIG-L family deacetylase [bacterium]